MLFNAICLANYARFKFRWSLESIIDKFWGSQRTPTFMYHSHPRERKKQRNAAGMFGTPVVWNNLISLLVLLLLLSATAGGFWFPRNGLNNFHFLWSYVSVRSLKFCVPSKHCFIMKYFIESRIKKKRCIGNQQKNRCGLVSLAKYFGTLWWFYSLDISFGSSYCQQR